MVEPVTLGALVASVLGMAAEAALKGSVGEAAKDTYHALRTKVARWIGADLELLEKEPRSKGRRAIVAEGIDKRSEDDKTEARELAQRLLAALKKEPVALDVGLLEATEVQLGKISVTAGGTGARFQEVRLTGPFRTGDIEVNPPGKEKR